MAETTNTTASGTARKSSNGTARKSSNGTARKSSTTRKSTTARKSTTRTQSPSKSTGRRTRTAAANRTREAAQANATAARVTADQGRSLAERAALVYVGATLEARDRVVEGARSLVDRYGTPEAAEHHLRRLETRFERRGNTARNQLERDVRKARTRLERAVRRNRQAVERDASRRRNLVSDRLGTVSTRVEDAVQTGVAAGERVATLARERVLA
jgi:hypothetical protein